ncbi:MAG: csaA [Chlamydiia bacterium]|nr:csaA [Chlamydiia bacterium]
MKSNDPFAKIDVHTGVVIAAAKFPEVRNALRLVIDFGPTLGKRITSTELSHLYRDDNLIGKQVLAVVNSTPKQISSFMSEVLVLGFANSDKKIS